MGAFAYSAPQMPAPPAPALQTFDKAIYDAAKDIVPSLADKGYKSVGVLKFGVNKDPNAPLVTVGTLNTLLASKTEAALFCLNGLAKPPLDITGDASEVAAAIPGADHKTPEGRNAIFSGQYRKMWGQNPTTPDVFIIGAAIISPDLKKMTIALYSFDKQTSPALLLLPFDVAMEASLLAQMGESHSPVAPALQDKLDQATHSAGALPTPQTISDLDAAKLAVNEAARQDALKVRQGLSHPLTNPDAPVKLVIKYDGVEQKIEYASGEARVAEPAATVKDVTFDLVRNSDLVYKAVLKVNGENTIYRQTAPDAECAGWLLSHDKGSPLTIVGYQLENQQAEKFRIMSEDESKTAVEKKLYGKYVGMVTLSVYRKPVAQVARAEDDEYKSLAMIGRGKRVQENSKSESYFDSVSRYMNNSTRGLIAPGERIPNKVANVDAVWDPIPVMTATVVYYKK